MLYPVPLKRGDRICVIDPANAFTEEGKRTARVFFERQGFQVTFSEEMAFKRGTKEQRAGRLNRVIRDAGNRGIFCMWGGYGSMTLLDAIDYQALKRNRPVFSGFSDITAMHLAIEKEMGLVTFHGPSLHSEKNPSTEQALAGLVEAAMHPQGKRELTNLDGSSLEILRGGACRGTLTGGNLTLVCRLMGTPYEIDTRGKILFLEEIGEKPYRIHGMLTQLKMAGKFEAAAGVVLGALTGCDDAGRPGSGLEAAQDVLQDLKCPVICGLKAGHIRDSLTLPLHGMAEIREGHLYTGCEGTAYAGWKEPL